MPQLRIGFLARDWTQVEPWVQRLVAHVNSDDRFDISTFIKGPRREVRPKKNWLYALINPVESRLFARAVAADPSDILDLLSIKPLLNSEQKNEISSLSLDVIVCVDSACTNSKIANSARHGVWFLDLFDQGEGRGALAAVSGRDAVAHIGLFCRESDDLSRKHIAETTINPKFLFSRNTLFMKEKAVVLILRELRLLAQSGRVSEINKPIDTVKHRAGTIDFMRYCFNVVKQFGKKGLATIKRRTGVRPDKFILLTGKGDALNFDPKTATEVTPEGNNFWADPFLWEADGKTYCFYEHYSRATKIGHIQVGVFDGDKMTVVGDALKSDIHLSFPYLFEHDDTLYMMPETCAAKRIEIWRCTDFPLEWELHSTALEGESVADSMILRRDGKWWLFTNIASDIYCDNCSELHIFQIDGPDLNSVVPHNGNPVVMDSRTARNAGRFHQIDGQIYRPSQDNAYGQYGYGLNIMEIKELSLDVYAETLVRRIDPKFDKTIVGCHHFDAKGERFIIDALKTN